MYAVYKCRYSSIKKVLPPFLPGVEQDGLFDFTLYLHVCQQTKTMQHNQTKTKSIKLESVTVVARYWQKLIGFGMSKGCKQIHAGSIHLHVDTFIFFTVSF